MSSPDDIYDRGKAKAARTNGGAVRFREQVRPTQLRGEPCIAKTQDETDFCQREIGRAARRFIRYRRERARPSKQGDRLLRARPRHIRLHLQKLPRIRLAALNALLRIQFIFLKRLQLGCGHTGRNAAFEISAVEKRDTLAYNLVCRVDVEPEQPFRWTAQGHAQLIDGQSLTESFDIRVRA